MGSCQNYGPFLGTLNIRCSIIRRTQKGTIILTTTHVADALAELVADLLQEAQPLQIRRCLEPGILTVSGFRV